MVYTARHRPAVDVPTVEDRTAWKELREEWRETDSHRGGRKPTVVVDSGENRIAVEREVNDNGRRRNDLMKIFIQFIASPDYNLSPGNSFKHCPAVTYTPPMEQLQVSRIMYHQLINALAYMRFFENSSNLTSSDVDTAQRIWNAMSVRKDGYVYWDRFSDVLLALFAPLGQHESKPPTKNEGVKLKLMRYYQSIDYQTDTSEKVPSPTRSSPAVFEREISPNTSVISQRMNTVADLRMQLETLQQRIRVHETKVNSPDTLVRAPSWDNREQISDRTVPPSKTPLANEDLIYDNNQLVVHPNRPPSFNQEFDDRTVSSHDRQERSPRRHESSANGYEGNHNKFDTFDKHEHPDDEKIRDSEGNLPRVLYVGVHGPQLVKQKDRDDKDRKDREREKEKEKEREREKEKEHEREQRKERERRDREKEREREREKERQHRERSRRSRSERSRRSRSERRRSSSRSSSSISSRGYDDHQRHKSREKKADRSPAPAWDYYEKHEKRHPESKSKSKSRDREKGRDRERERERERQKNRDWEREQEREREREKNREWEREQEREREREIEANRDREREQEANRERETRGSKERDTYYSGYHNERKHVDEERERNRTMFQRELDRERERELALQQKLDRLRDEDVRRDQEWNDELRMQLERTLELEEDLRREEAKIKIKQQGRHDERKQWEERLPHKVHRVAGTSSSGRNTPDLLEKDASQWRNQAYLKYPVPAPSKSSHIEQEASVSELSAPVLQTVREMNGSVKVKKQSVPDPGVPDLKRSGYHATPSQTLPSAPSFSAIPLVPHVGCPQSPVRAEPVSRPGFNRSRVCSGSPKREPSVKVPIHPRESLNSNASTQPYQSQQGVTQPQLQRVSRSETKKDHPKIDVPQQQQQQQQQHKQSVNNISPVHHIFTPTAPPVGPPPRLPFSPPTEPPPIPSESPIRGRPSVASLQERRDESAKHRNSLGNQALKEKWDGIMDTGTNNEEEANTFCERGRRQSASDIRRASSANTKRTTGEKQRTKSASINPIVITDSSDEVIISRDPDMKLGISFHSHTILSSVAEGSAAHVSGVGKYLNRRVTHINSQPVKTLSAIRTACDGVNILHFKFEPGEFNEVSLLSKKNRV